MLNRITSIRNTDLNHIFEQSQTKYCYFYSKEDLFNAYGYLKKNKTVIMTNMSKMFDKLLKYNSGFGCSICDPDNHKYFETNPEGKMFVRTTIDSCRVFLNSVAYLFPDLLYPLHLIQVIMKAIGCVLSLPFSIDLSLNKINQKTIFEEEIKKCDSNEAIINSDKCLLFCNYTQFNGNKGAYLVEIFEITNNLLDLIEERNGIVLWVNLYPTDKVDYKELVFNQYLDVLNSDLFYDIENMPVYVDFEGGWNLFNNKMEYEGVGVFKIWGALALVFGFCF